MNDPNDVSAKAVIAMMHTILTPEDAAAFDACLVAIRAAAAQAEQVEPRLGRMAVRIIYKEYQEQDA